MGRGDVVCGAGCDLEPTFLIDAVARWLYDDRAVRPYNPEGLAVIERIEVHDLTVVLDGRPALLLPDHPAGTRGPVQLYVGQPERRPVVVELAAQGGRLAMYNADGSQDMTFGTNGFRAIEGSNQAIVSRRLTPRARTSDRPAPGPASSLPPHRQPPRAAGRPR